MMIVLVVLPWASAWITVFSIVLVNISWRDKEGGKEIVAKSQSEMSRDQEEIEIYKKSDEWNNAFEVSMVLIA